MTSWTGQNGVLRMVCRSAAFFVILALAVPARADVPPSPNSPDAHCSKAEQCPNGVFCPYSFHPGHPPQPGEPVVGEACRSEASSKGLSHRCRSGGNYSGEALFCPQGETGTWKPPSEKSASRCAATPGGAGADGIALVIAGAIAAVARRRARR